MDRLLRRQRRKADVKDRAQRPNQLYKFCRIVGCGKPARAASSDGLDTRHCRSHADLFQRHGSPYRRSDPASVLNPYRRAALAWLKTNKEEFWVRNAVERVLGLYHGAGQHEEAF